MTDKEVPAGRDGVHAVWPSARRAFATVFWVFSLPLLLLAAVSAAKLLSALGWMKPHGMLQVLIAWQSEAIAWMLGLLANLRLTVPSYLVDGALVHVFIGNAVARAERDELMAVELDEGAAWETFRDALRHGRTDLFFYSLPWLTRHAAIRILWPLVAVYRWRTPWVVEGPGPDGDDISTSVHRKDIQSFADMVRANGAWAAQTVYDHRLVLGFQIGLGLLSSLALQGLSLLLGSR